MGYFKSPPLIVKCEIFGSNAAQVDFFFYCKEETALHWNAKNITWKAKGKNNNNNNHFYNIGNISKKDLTFCLDLKKFVVNEKICNAKYVKINKLNRSTIS